MDGADNGNLIDPLPFPAKALEGRRAALHRDGFIIQADMQVGLAGLVEENKEIL